MAEVIREVFMSSKQAAVRQVLDRVKGEGRTSLAPVEAKALCDAYGIPVPNEGLATSGSSAGSLMATAEPMITGSVVLAVATTRGALGVAESG